MVAPQLSFAYIFDLINTISSFSSKIIPSTGADVALFPFFKTPVNIDTLNVFSISGTLSLLYDFNQHDEI